MITRLAAAILLPLLFLPAHAASAAEVADVRIDDKARVANAELTLNGAGLRKRVFFQVYAIGLYLPEKKSVSTEVIAATGPKRVAIHMLRDVDADQFSGALADGIKEAKKGMTIALDWTGKATQVVVDGKAVGQPIAGEDFYRALLRIWLGDKPVQEDLKKSLLGS